MAIDQYGQIVRRTPRPIPIRTNPNISTGYNSTSYSTSTPHYRTSLWNRFDNFIGSIGNWFADSSEGITSILSIILLICMAIPFIVWLFSLGLFLGILAGIFLGGIAYYAAMIVVGIFIWISNICLGVIRYIFYSGTTFLIALAIAGTFIGYGCYASSQLSTKYTPRTESAAPVITKYYCTAKILNVRSAPSANAAIIGSLKQYQVVDVYVTTNGFAKIKYGSRDGYVSLQYMKQWK
nr:SH3 domain-containing protein [Prevotella sp.]